MMDIVKMYIRMLTVRTTDGGSHVVGYRASLTKVINEYARKHGVLKDRDKNFEGVDIREGLSAIVSVSIPKIYCNSKDKLRGNWERLKLETWLNLLF